ncbi:MAG: HIT domain-containing protein [Ignavibacteriales bacterium]|nr:HIT domain-containing protein [Ignavibacteriales bacterium]
MKRLFSPWRSIYIQTFKKPKKNGKCLFCRMAREKKDAKNFIVYRGKHAFIVMNLYPYNSGHVMIVPYRHVDSLEKLGDREQAEILTLTAKAQKALRTLSKPQGFNFGANFGRIAGAGIDEHIHFHLVPRWSGDTNFMPVLADTKLISEEMRKTREGLRKKLIG